MPTATRLRHVLFPIFLLAACRSGTTAPGDAGAPDGAVDMSAASDLSSVFVPDGGVLAVPLTGCYNTHLLPVTIGGNQTFQLNVDTGSASLGVAAAGCTGCQDNGVSTLYAPGPQAKDLSMKVSSTYDTGELGWSGEGYQDLVAIGGVSTELDFAAITSQNSYFFANSCDTPSGEVPAQYDGIIGFGPPSLLVAGTTSFLDQIQHAGKIDDVFALSFCHGGGTLWLGGYDESALAAPAQFVPMTTTDGYEVAWNGITVQAPDGDAGAGTAVSLPAGTQALTDSGGVEWILPEPAFTQVAAAINGDPAFQSIFGASFLTTSASAEMNCRTLTQKPSELDALLPSLTLQLGDASHAVEVTLPASVSYLIYSYGDNGSVTYCQDLIDGTTAGYTIYYVGQSVMANRVLIMDVAHQQMGFAERKEPCAF
jgi:hypothetical protein